MRERVGIWLGWILFLGILGSAWMFSGPIWSHAKGPLDVVCIGTAEDADSALLSQNGAAILIDAGEEQDAEHILEIIKEHQVEKLDYLILTHGDGDHIGGAQKIAENIPIGMVVESVYESSGERMESLNTYFQSRNIPILYPNHAYRLEAGQMQLIVYPPLEKHYSDNNNASLAVLVRHGDVNMMFAGDALRKRSEELLHIDWPPVGLYKVAHHGRANSMTGELFDRVKPSYGVVTAKSADQAVIDAAEKNGTKLFYTGDGDCRFVCDGKSIVPIEKKEKNSGGE